MRTCTCFFSLMTPAPWQAEQGEVIMEPLGLAHLPLTLAAGTGLARTAGLPAIPLAPGAAHAAFHRQTAIQSPGGFLQGQHHRLSQVGARLGLIRPVPGASETEEIPEDLPKGTEDIFEAAESAQVQARQPGIAIKVVKLTLLRVGQDLVCLGNLFEPVFRHLIPGVLVRVILEGQPPVSGSDLLQGSLSRDLQNFIVGRHPETTTSPLGLQMPAHLSHRPLLLSSDYPLSRMTPKCCRRNQADF
jgi:hypothetical protein